MLTDNKTRVALWGSSVPARAPVRSISLFPRALRIHQRFCNNPGDCQLAGVQLRSWQEVLTGRGAHAALFILHLIVASLEALKARK